MSNALQAIDRAIAALTYEQVEHIPVDGGDTLSGDQVPLLQRSIGQDLTRIEATIAAKGCTLLAAIAASIDEALMALAEGRESLLSADTTEVPILPIKLVNMPRRSEDPRLSRGNDNPGASGRPDLLGGEGADA